jgi:hypothetical protein
MKSLNKKELKELLIKCWMTHDGMWFYHSLKECGIEKTNKINKAAIKSMAKIEIERIKKAFGLGKINTFKDLNDLIDKALEVFKADFMVFTYNFPRKNHLCCEMSKCFAFEGIKHIGAINKYECGIFNRIEGWFDSLNIKYEVKPKIEGCLMHTNRRCFRNYKFYFKE